MQSRRLTAIKPSIHHPTPIDRPIVGL